MTAFFSDCCDLSWCYLQFLNPLPTPTVPCIDSLIGLQCPGALEQKNFFQHFTTYQCLTGSMLSSTIYHRMHWLLQVISMRASTSCNARSISAASSQFPTVAASSCLLVSVATARRSRIRLALECASIRSYASLSKWPYCRFAHSSGSDTSSLNMPGIFCAFPLLFRHPCPCHCHLLLQVLDELLGERLYDRQLDHSEECH